MPINDWFKQRESRRYTVSSAEAGAELPDGVWRTCPECKKTLYQGDVAKSMSVCLHCDHHFDLIARDRIELLADEDSFAETDEALMEKYFEGEEFTKEELVHKMLQLQLRELAMFYKDKNDLADQKFNADDRGGDSRRDRDRDRGRDRERGGDRGERREFSRDGGRESRDRKPRRNNTDMVRFFFNLGKKDQLKKMDMLEIINKSTAKSKKRPDIGDIEILEKFSFFEVEKSFKDEVMKGMQSQKFKGKEMRAEIAG